MHNKTTSSILLWIFITLVTSTQDQNTSLTGPTEFDWFSWWSYDGISGPGFWGVINRRWRLCSDGRRQSPVDVLTSSLVYDHTLVEMVVDSHEIDGQLSNTGFGLQWTPVKPNKEDSSSLPSSPSGTTSGSDTFMVTGGPFHYKYRLSHVSVRWSASSKGSEHTLEGQSFPAEVQLFFFNADLYGNFSSASDRPNGIAAVAVLIKVGWRSNPVLKIWMDHLHLVPHNGKSTWTPFVPIRELFSSKQFLSYEGSLTEPPCEETVTWVILNKPVYVTADQLYQLQSIRRGAQGQSSLSAGNVRPLQSLHNRFIRTNIIPHSLSCSKNNPADTYRALHLDES